MIFATIIKVGEGENALLLEGISSEVCLDIIKLSHIVEARGSLENAHNKSTYYK